MGMNKLKYWTYWNFDLMVTLEETKVIAVYPEWFMNVCRNFYGNPSNSCCDISLKTTRITIFILHHLNE